MTKTRLARCAALALIAAVLVSCERHRERLPVLHKASEFDLVNQDNQPVSLSRFEGKVKVLGFIYSRCQQATMCPMTMRKFRALQQSLGDEISRRTVLLLVSFDPVRDSSGVLKQFGEFYDADFANWHFLTGDSLSIEAVCRSYQVIAEKEQDQTFRHSIITFLIDRNNNVRKMQLGSDWEPEDILRHIASLLKEKA